jgi:light-regulated signal transduction histidine kinase (bacteriophytochrome)
MTVDAEVATLIASLHETERRLEELTAGEVDSVMDPTGRTSLLRHAQEELRDSEAAKQAVILELESANRDLEAFSHSVSHDLRTPLHQIIGFVELLLQDPAPSLPAQHLEFLTTIRQSATHMGTLIDDLLSFSHTGHMELCKTQIDAGLLVKDALGDFQSQTAARGIVWKINPLPQLWADRALLRMVLINLMSNAVKFTSGRADPQIEIGCAPGAGDETVFFIRDNGAGFDPAGTDKLFGVFQRLHTQSQFKGTGIGLANVKRIIQRHGGRTWADGIVDGGATFYFSMPGTRKTVSRMLREDTCDGGF